jgi:hypothetical protein
MPGYGYAYICAGSGSVTRGFHVTKKEFGDFFRPDFFLCSTCAKNCANHRDHFALALERSGIADVKFYWAQDLFPYYDKLLQLKGGRFCRICNLMNDKLTDAAIHDEDALLTINMKGSSMLLIDDVVDAVSLSSGGIQFQRRIEPGTHNLRGEITSRVAPSSIHVEAGKSYVIEMKRNLWNVYRFICHEAN